MLAVHLPVERSTYHYRSRRAGQAELTERIKEIAATRVRYGYRRIHVLLRREGWPVNAKRVYRLYRENGPAIAQQNAEAAGEGEASRRTGSRRRERTRPGRWTSCTINWRPAASCAC